MRRVLGIALLIVGLLAIPAQAASTHVLTGTITLEDTFRDTRDCTGSEGYDDIQRGAQVTVRDAKNKLIASGQLGPGSPDKFGFCAFAFKFKIPEATFYTIEVAHRGGLTYSAKKLAKQKYAVIFTLG